MQSNDTITQADKQQRCITKKLESCEFNNKFTLVGDLCKQLETTEAMTSAYHFQTNGLTGTWHMRSQLSHNTRYRHAAYYNYYNQH